jgi:hypothetical protein
VDIESFFGQSSSLGIVEVTYRPSLLLVDDGYWYRSHIEGMRCRSDIVVKMLELDLIP